MHNFGYDEDGWSGTQRDHHLWRKIFRYSSKYYLGLLLALVLSLLMTGAALALPRLMQIGIDSFITATNMPVEERTHGLGILAFIYGALVIVVFLAGFFQIVTLERIGQSIMHTIRQDLFSYLLKLDLAFFNKQPVGRLVTRLTNDIQNMNEMFTSVLVTLFNDFLKLSGILVLLYMMNFRLALLLSIFVPLSILVTIVFARLAREKFRAIRQQLVKLNSFLQESIFGLKIIQLFGRQEDNYRAYVSLSEGYAKRTLAQIKLFGTFMPLTEFMSSLAIALIVWYGGGEIIRRELTLGELVAFLSYMRLFFQPLRELSQKYSIVQSALASAERVFELFDTRIHIQSPDDSIALSEINGAIKFDNVSFGYEKGELILHDINFDISAGETVAIVGSTGAGKSTLINLLIRFYDPQQGSILLDKANIRNFPVNDLRKVIGVIMQDVFILPDTLLANIVLETGVSRDKVLKIISETGMEGFVEGLPSGLDTLIGEGNLDLSAGEKQLLCFARVLCRDPAILILDEATSSIDTATENMLERTVAASFKGRTSLVIAHRLSTIRRADRIIVMDSGRVKEQGTHEDLMSLQGLYYNLVNLDLQQDENGMSRSVSDQDVK